jgi:putative ABC transport system permease protein
MTGGLLLPFGRQRLRTALAVAGVAVAGALLLDMVMLSTGMRSSFRTLLLVRGYQLRVTPKGTLPFDNDATIPRASEVLRALAANPAIAAATPVLGAQLHLLRPSGPPVTSFALGVDPTAEGDYALEEGRDPALPDRVIVNAVFARLAATRIGDTLDLAAAFDPELRAVSGRRRLVVAGRGRFFYTPADQPVIALPLAALQAMEGSSRTDRVSLVMVRVRPGVDPEQAASSIERAVPRVSAISITSALRQVDERMGYFRQLALVLGAISLVVAFLLVTTLVTVSVQEHAGEIAVLRAIGVSRRHVIRLIALEALALTACGAVAGVGLGLVTAHYFNAILSDFPDLPAGFRFFVFQPAAGWTTVALLVGSGLLAGLYPAWSAASRPVASALRREAVA